MDKKEIKKSMDETVLKLKGICKDAKYADTLIDKLLSLKGQYDVEALAFNVKEKDKVKEYDYDSFVITVYTSGIMFKNRGGYHVWISPRMETLYNFMLSFIHMKDDYEELDENQRRVYNIALVAITYIFNAPIYAPLDDDFFFGVAADIKGRLEALVDKLNKEPLHDETYVDDAEFENQREVIEEITKDIK